MSTKKNAIFAMIAFSFLLSLNASVVAAHPAKEYDAVVKQLKTQYRAKKVNLVFMWLARAAVSVVRPAGVKSFSLTVFQNLKFSPDSIDSEMQATMRQAYGPDWSPIFHVRSRTGEQAYMYMKDDGSNVRVVLVTIEKEQAAIIRATFSPDKLIEFLNNPKIMGIRLNDDQQVIDVPLSTAKSDTSKEQ